MKTILTLSLAACIVCVWDPAAGQSILNKYQKTPAPAVQQQAAQGIAAGGVSTGGIMQNLNRFLAKAGVARSTARSASGPASGSVMAVNGSAALALPSIRTPATGTIESVAWDAAAGTPRFIQVRSGSAPILSKAATASEKTDAANVFLARHAALLNIADPSSELLVKEISTDDLRFTNIKYTQQYKGLEVWGREYIVHFDARGELVSANGGIARSPVGIGDVTGRISQREAVQTALREMAKKTEVLPVPAKAAVIMKYAGPTAQKVIWHDAANVPHLVWVVESRSGLSQDWRTFVDAHSGRVLDSYNAVCYDGVANGSGADLNGAQRSFRTYQVGSEYLLLDASQPMYNAAQSKVPDSPIGGIMTLDLRSKDLTSSSSIYYFVSANTSWSDPSAVSAHYNATLTYRYFLDTHGRNSVDNKGMTIYSVVHATDGGKGMENAFWSGQIMCYGDGGTYFKPLAGGLDVAAHEMTHGVTQYTSNLEYKGQSGALNESFSDVFGALVDTANWTMGEKIIKNLQAFPSGAMRNLADPHNGSPKGSNGWQPATMSEFQTMTEDNGGVHVNSGIPNRAFYLTAASTGRLKAGKIWYRAATVYLTRSSQFIDARIATLKAAADLYGASGAEATSVKNAWDGVEVFDATAPPPPPATTLTGSDYILMVNTDPADPNSIYMVKPTIATNADFFVLSKTPALNRPSVSDVSGVVLFIDKLNNLRALNADPKNPLEEVIDNSGVWESVSIGPGINSLALTSKFIDTTIYYFDLVNNVEKTFKIATKSFDAADSKTALYADALSFDPTGKYILFDAYNELKKASGDKMTFWNINILDVATGTMGVIFPPLAEGLSVGNPSFSKTLGTRFAFDYIDGNTGKTSVMAADFNTGDVGLVAGPQTEIGYPSFSADDKTIAYHTSDATSGSARHSIEQMPLKASFIEGTGSPKKYVLDATFPVWFLVGKRTTDVDRDASLVPAVFSVGQNYPNPFNPSTRIRYSLPRSERVVIAVYDMLGSRVAELVNGTMNAGTHDVTWNGTDDSGKTAASGAYLVTISAGSEIVTRKMMLLK